MHVSDPVVFHYPPQLTQLLIDTIPLLCRSKRDVVLFFVGAGFPEHEFPDVAATVHAAPAEINKYEITRELITLLNSGGDRWLRQRREVVRRVTEFDDFSTCWPKDQLRAKGLVAEIRSLVGVKDAFTRMKIEHDRARAAHSAAAEARTSERAARQRAADAIRRNLAALFLEPNPQRRGKALEGVLNALFRHHGISLRESFSLRSGATGREVEQIDGVIELSNAAYFVEMKWLNEPVGVNEISPHLVRVYQRAESRALFISASEYTEAAVRLCRDALQQKLVILASLEEIVKLTERDADLVGLLNRKVDLAINERRPWVKLLPK
ncbi:MAG: restriction endonuclease [Polyangiaceae bacterium]|nr:restriction endonuclease [Polyangiaceae bacterium]